MQMEPNLETIQSMGFLLADHCPGPYSVEIDFIKLSNLEELAEMDADDLKYITTRNLVLPDRKRCRAPHAAIMNAADDQLPDGWILEPLKKKIT